MRKTKKTEITDVSSMTISELESIMTVKELAFIEQYEITNDLALSAQRVGYTYNKSRSAYATGSKLLREPKIAAYIKLRRHELFERLNLNTETLTILALTVYNRTMQGTPRVFWNHETQKYEPDGTVLIDCKSAVCALKLAGDIIRVSDQKTTEKQLLDVYLESLGLEEEEEEEV